MSKLTLDEAIKHCLETAEQLEERANTPYKCEDSELQDNACRECAADHRQLAEWLTELKEAKQLLKAAVKDFAKLDRENAKNKNCMMPEMHCADCPLNRDSVDDRAEPCHSWRYADEALKLLGDDTNE